MTDFPPPPPPTCSGSAAYAAREVITALLGEFPRWRELFVYAQVNNLDIEQAVARLVNVGLDHEHEVPETNPLGGADSMKRAQYGVVEEPPLPTSSAGMNHDSPTSVSAATQIRGGHGSHDAQRLRRIRDDRIRELHAAGWTQLAIAEEVGWSKGVVYEVIQKLRDNQQ